jgi:hypothetical protein
MQKTLISKTKDHFKKLNNEVLSRFESFSKLETIHSISEYKREYDEIRLHINILGIIDNSEFNTIKYAKIDDYYLIFIIDDRCNELIITVGITKNNGTVYPDIIDKIKFQGNDEFEYFKLSINNFNKDILQNGYSIQKKYKVKLLLKSFNTFFIKQNKNNLINRNSQQKNQKLTIEQIIDNMKISLQKTFHEYELAKKDFQRKNNKERNTMRDIRLKVKEYEKMLLKEYKVEELNVKRVKANIRLLNARKKLTNNIQVEYKKNKIYIFSSKLENILNKIFN